MTSGPDQPPREAGGPEGGTTSVGWPGQPAHPPGAPVRPAERSEEQPAGAPDDSRSGLGDEPTAAVETSNPGAAAQPAPPRPTMPPGPPVAPPRPSAPPVASPAAPTRPMSVGPTAAATATASSRKGGRRARLTVKRIDPWSTLKFSFVYSLAGVIVLLVAVIALYAVVDAMGVIDSIQSFLRDVGGDQMTEWLSFGRVLGITLVLGGVNVILFTAFATLTAFIYNVCTELVGGIEVTLAERG